MKYKMYFLLMAVCALCHINDANAKAVRSVPENSEIGEENILTAENNITLQRELRQLIIDVESARREAEEDEEVKAKKASYEKVKAEKGLSSEETRSAFAIYNESLVTKMDSMPDIKAKKSRMREVTAMLEYDKTRNKSKRAKLSRESVEKNKPKVKMSATIQEPTIEESKNIVKKEEQISFGENVVVVYIDKSGKYKIGNESFDKEDFETKMRLLLSTKKVETVYVDFDDGEVSIGVVSKEMSLIRKMGFDDVRIYK